MSDWHSDPLLEGFEAKTLEFPADYDGAVVATLVRLPAGSASRGAVLYVHGFVDYFFQRHMALRFAQEGYAFHALDLRKHGRSLLAHQHPCFCKRIDEYYPEITRALQEIGQPVLLAGHSTGGLVCSLYAAEGERRGQLRALWLNRPFFEFYVPPSDRLPLRLSIALGSVWPFMSNPRALN
ncbi:MAG: alpha/beta hydrolase, partial [Burkholderiales bacterium]